jgi:hypothetical protein
MNARGDADGLADDCAPCDGDDAGTAGLVALGAGRQPPASTAASMAAPTPSIRGTRSVDIAQTVPVVVEPVRRAYGPRPTGTIDPQRVE